MYSSLSIVKCYIIILTSQTYKPLLSVMFNLSIVRNGDRKRCDVFFSQPEYQNLAILKSFLILSSTSSQSSFHCTDTVFIRPSHVVRNEDDGVFLLATSSSVLLDFMLIYILVLQLGKQCDVTHTWV